MNDSGLGRFHWHLRVLVNDKETGAACALNLDTGKYKEKKHIGKLTSIPDDRTLLYSCLI